MRHVNFVARRLHFRPPVTWRSPRANLETRLMPLDGVAETWFVKVAEKVYGPYSRDHMARYVAEGRVTPKSLVALSAAGAWEEAGRSAALQAVLSETRPAFKIDNGEPAELGNLLVIISLASSASRQFDYELRQMGSAVEISTGIYLLRTNRTAGAVRNALSQMMNRGDKLIVLDSTRDRLAWFNLGPETDARIREVWNAPGRH